MEKLWTWLKSICLRKWWYVILLIISSIYVWHYRFSIIDFSTIEAQDLIFFLWLILILFPLFSEIEILGVKVKKEIEKSVQEVKDSITELRLQVVSNSATSSANQTMNLYTLSIEQMRALAKQIETLNEEGSRRDESSSKINTEVMDVPEQASFLFKVRYIIETKLSVFDRAFIYEGKYRNTHSLLLWLKHEDLLDEETFTLIDQIVIIANRGIHGETVGDDYIEFIKQVFPCIQEKLDSAIKKKTSGKLFGFFCPKCKYRGYSKEEFICPICGFSLDDC